MLILGPFTPPLELIIKAVNDPFGKWYQWNPFHETQITADKLQAHHTKSTHGLEGPDKAQQCLSNAQIAMNHVDFKNADIFLQQGIEALKSDVNSIAKNPNLLARLMVESVLVRHTAENPNILNNFNPDDENSLGAFIKETNIDAIPETNLGQIDQLKQDLKRALESRKNSLAKANQVKSSEIYTDLKTVNSSVKLKEQKPEIPEAPSSEGGALDAREVLVKLAQNAGMPKTANEIRNQLDEAITPNVTMTDNDTNIDVTIADETKPLTPEKAWILVQRLNAEKANRTGAPIQFDDRIVTFTDDDGTISLVEGQTPLHFAALNGHTEEVRALLEKGADVTAKDNNGNTPLHFAALNGHTAVVQELLKNGANVTATDNNGNTPLHFAALNGHTEEVRALLEKNADVTATDNNGSTPLHYAACYGHTEVVQALLLANANKDEKNTLGNTPLHYAANAGKLNVVQELLLADANKDEKNTLGNTPLQLATLNKHTEVQKLLAEEVDVTVEDRLSSGDS